MSEIPQTKLEGYSEGQSEEPEQWAQEFKLPLQRTREALKVFSRGLMGSELCFRNISLAAV